MKHFHNKISKNIVYKNIKKKKIRNIYKNQKKNLKLNQR